MALTGSALVAFAATTDPERAERFYTDTLGLTLVSQTSFALVYDANGTMLRVTRVERLDPAGYTVLGWSVDDIDDVAKELTDRGVTLLRYEGLTQDERGIWTAPDGDRVAWFKDPDGNVLSMTQF